MLAWSLAYNHYTAPLPGDGLVPFLIDWASPSPATTAPDGCELVSLRAEHPDPTRYKLDRPHMPCHICRRHDSSMHPVPYPAVLPIPAVRALPTPSLRPPHALPTPSPCRPRFMLQKTAAVICAD